MVGDGKTVFHHWIAVNSPAAVKQRLVLKLIRHVNELINHKNGVLGLSGIAVGRVNAKVGLVGKQLSANSCQSRASLVKAGVSHTGRLARINDAGVVQW